MAVYLPIIVGFIAGMVGTGLGGTLPFLFPFQGRR